MMLKNDSKDYLYLTVDPFSEEEEQLMNALIACEVDGHTIEYDFITTADGSHKYRLNERDMRLYDACYPFLN